MLPYHVVCTLPASISDIVYQNKAAIYDILFKTSAETLITIAANHAYHEDSFAYWAARLMVAFCVTRNQISQEDADAWLMSLSDAQEAGRFFSALYPS